METETPFKEGYLLSPPQGFMHLKKSWHKKYCQLFKMSMHGIQRLEIFDNEDDAWKQAPVRIITLENCVKITPDAQKHQQFVFAIVTKTGKEHFATLSEVEFCDWISILQSVAFGDNSSKETIEEDNELYCSSGEGIFVVKVVPTKAAEKCGMEGSYTLIISSSSLQLRNNQDKLLFMWPYKYIRRYGYRDGKFTFEAGRKCESGEGVFQFEHHNQQEIFRCMSSKMNYMKKVLNAPQSPGIICGENQFHAACNMEARSRSPLPPSPTGATTSPLFDIDVHQGIFKPLGLSNKESPFVSNTTLYASKVKPLKPPRRSLKDKLPDAPHSAGVYRKHSGDGQFSPEATTNSLPLSADVSVFFPRQEPSPYDSVVIRKDAWKTLGVDDITHTENIPSDTEEDRSRSTANDVFEDMPKSQCSKILMQPLPGKTETAENYDKLQHFGTQSSKSEVNHGYKKIPLQLLKIDTPPEESTKSPDFDDLAWNSYATVEENMQACRLADDSHYGYGMIRKKSVEDIKNIHNSGPEHEVYNDIEYAVVNKPKKASPNNN